MLKIQTHIRISLELSEKYKYKWPGIAFFHPKCQLCFNEQPYLKTTGLYNWRRKWQPTPVFLPGESKGQKSLAGHGPWGHGDSDTTEPTKHTWTI